MARARTIAVSDDLKYVQIAQVLLFAFLGSCCQPAVSCDDYVVSSTCTGGTFFAGADGRCASDGGCGKSILTLCLLHLNCWSNQARVVMRALVRLNSKTTMETHHCLVRRAAVHSMPQPQIALILVV